MLLRDGSGELLWVECCLLFRKCADIGPWVGALQVHAVGPHVLTRAARARTTDQPEVPLREHVGADGVDSVVFVHHDEWYLCGSQPPTEGEADEGRGGLPEFRYS